MNGLRKTDIEGIERHIHNYKLFVFFLKKERMYLFFKKLMFIDINRYPVDLFKTMNETKLCYVVIHCSSLDVIDRKWSAVFSYVPFFGGRWDSKKGIGYTVMSPLLNKWCKFLDKYNYDNFKFGEDDITFEFD